MNNLLETESINLPFNDNCDYCFIRSVNAQPILSLTFTSYADTKYIINVDYAQELNDKIRDCLQDLTAKNVTNKNTMRSEVMKLVKKYADFTINRTA